MEYLLLSCALILRCFENSKFYNPIPVKVFSRTTGKFVGIFWEMLNTDTGDSIYVPIEADVEVCQKGRIVSASYIEDAETLYSCPIKRGQAVGINGDAYRLFFGQEKRGYYFQKIG